MKGSLLIIGFFVLGIVVGRSTGLPTAWSLADVSFAALCLLMAAVGFSIGHDPSTLSRFRRLNPRLALLPLCTIGGTLTACALASLLTPHSVAEGMAVGAGFGYYSLSGILITSSKGAELGTGALLSNIIRELLTLLGAPLLARWFGSLAPIAAGGATTADTTLPVITRTCGDELAVVSIYHGMVVDFSVPFLVTFFCSLG